LEARGQRVVVAFEAAPFGEMVCNVESCRNRCGILVVDERDICNRGRLVGLMSMKDNVPGKKIAMPEDQLWQVQLVELDDWNE